MPYKLSEDKKAVMVKRHGKWAVLHRYKGKNARKKALQLLTALSMNVKH